MRILHIENTAGVAFALSRGQRELGHQADVLETYWSPLAFAHDLEFYYNGNPWHDSRMMRQVVRAARDYDIVHVHAGVHWKRFDVLAISRLLRKPMVIHYHGSESRMGYGMAYRRLWKNTIVGRPDLLRYHPDAVFIRNPVIGVQGSPVPEGRVRIMHAFHNPGTKGSELIREALQELVDAGAEMDFVILEKVGHEEVLREMARSHIVIDQVVDAKANGLPSVIGVVALEAMAMGRAVVSSFDKEYRGYYPDCPVVAIEPDKAGLASALKCLVEDRAAMNATALAGPGYVERNHSPLAIAKIVMQVYEKAVAGNEGGAR
jgi:glycosyltransferase involved in cell wall biosynthesis